MPGLEYPPPILTPTAAEVASVIEVVVVPEVTPEIVEEVVVLQTETVLAAGERANNLWDFQTGVGEGTSQPFIIAPPFINEEVVGFAVSGAKSITQNNCADVSIITNTGGLGPVGMGLFCAGKYFFPIGTTFITQPEIPAIPEIGRVIAAHPGHRPPASEQQP